MPAGRYDHYASIQTATASNDAGGNAVYTWSTIAMRWASLDDASGKEVLRAQKIDSTIDAVIVLREQLEDLAPDDRVQIDGRTFEIKAVLGSSDRTTKRGQAAYCTEVV